MIRLPKLLENHDYRFYLSGLFVSAIGDGMQFVATGSPRH